MTFWVGTEQIVYQLIACAEIHGEEHGAEERAKQHVFEESDSVFGKVKLF